MSSHDNSSNQQKQSIQKSSQKKQSSRWTSDEQILYENFLEKNKQLVQTGHKQNHYLFYLMSQFIPTRNPIQCRSHHQKFFKKLNKNDKKIKKQKVYQIKKKNDQNPIQDNHQNINLKNHNWKIILQYVDKCQNILDSSIEFMNNYVN